MIDALLPWDRNRLKALDVGCGGGSSLIRMERAGWDVEGVEWDSAAAEVARRVSGRKVTAGSFFEVELPPASYDLVVLNHVFEHLDDPLGALRRIKALLKPGGRAVLVYPNPNSLGSRLFGPHWVNWDPPRHLVIPPIGALCRAARELGFSRVDSMCLPGSAAFDFGVSRVYRRGESIAGLPRRVVDLRDRIASVVESVLTSAGFAVGEHAVIVAHQEN
jgi:SAM-dependent methyltransferase